MDWVEVSDTLIGEIKFDTAAPVAYTIPALPERADQVLIFLYGYSGSGSSSFARVFDIWTAEPSGLKYRMKFFIYTYPQQAVGFNSENMWFPLTGEHKLYVKQTSNILNSNNITGRIYLIGYARAAQAPLPPLQQRAGVPHPPIPG